MAQLERISIPKKFKDDPELPSALTGAAKTRKLDMLSRGLSTNYVELCFSAYNEGIVTAGRLAEMLLVDNAELPNVAALFGKSLSYAD